MSSRNHRLCALLPFLFLAACVAGQSLETAYTPPAPAQPAAAAVAAKVSVHVTVTDDRPYVKSGDKPPHYIGKYRAGFGNPWNVYTQNDEPLASVLARDLGADVVALGYDVNSATAADRRLEVSIREWNFDGYQNGKMWYELQSVVRDGAGKIVATNTVLDETAIKGTLWTGAKGGFEREMPKLYATAVTRLVRDNQVVSAALRGEKP
jgi:uncharacterized lipoprotein YajG